MDVLHVKHTLTHDGKPLAVVDNLPGGFAELRPEQLRMLAAALSAAADDCEKHASMARSRYARTAFSDYPLKAA